MKNLIKYIAVALLMLGVGQAASAQFRYAAIAGPTFTNLHFKQDLVTVDGTAAMQAGLQTEMMFPGVGFGIDFGLIYNMAGAKVNLGERLMWQSQGYGNERLMLHQLTIPFHLRFKFQNLNGMEENFAPFLYAGPDFNILAAHSKCDAMEFAHGDLSLTFGAGVELHRRWQISGQYTLGATYALKAKVLENYSATCRQWAVRLAYFF